MTYPFDAEDVAFDDERVSFEGLSTHNETTGGLRGPRGRIRSRRYRVDPERWAEEVSWRTSTRPSPN